VAQLANLLGYRRNLDCGIAAYNDITMHDPTRAEFSAIIGVVGCSELQRSSLSTVNDIRFDGDSTVDTTSRKRDERRNLAKWPTRSRLLDIEFVDMMVKVLLGEASGPTVEHFPDYRLVHLRESLTAPLDDHAWSPLPRSRTDLST
jgi:hypothetical protein